MSKETNFLNHYWQSTIETDKDAKDRDTENKRAAFYNSTTEAARVAKAGSTATQEEQANALTSLSCSKRGGKGAPKTKKKV